MTFERQNLMEDIYAGNTVDITVTIYEDEQKTVVKDLTGAEITWSLFTDDNRILLTKSSVDSGITAPTPGNGQCIVHILPPDTTHIYGTFNHMLNVVDANDDESTVLTGKIRIFKSFAKRPRDGSLNAYLEGG